jgi:hypothetical protein
MARVPGGRGKSILAKHLIKEEAEYSPHDGETDPSAVVRLSSLTDLFHESCPRFVDLFLEAAPPGRTAAKVLVKGK